MQIILGFLFFLYGACFGSFFNVLIYRIPKILKGEQLNFNAPSYCPNCKIKIKYRYNIPIIGWVLLNGKCYNCKLPISKRYILFEIFWAILFLIIYLICNTITLSIIILCLLYIVISVIFIIMEKKKTT